MSTGEAGSGMRDDGIYRRWDYKNRIPGQLYLFLEAATCGLWVVSGGSPIQQWREGMISGPAEVAAPLHRRSRFYTECLAMKLLRKRDISEEKYTTNAFLVYTWRTTTSSWSSPTVDLQSLHHTAHFVKKDRLWHRQV
uniref:Uncharacterized protein n=1 Tax=Oryza punctata TaxID=4537 RepID=A0A0E0M085_ORYPU